MTRAGLTPRLAELLEFIRAAVERDGFSPTRAEMADALDLSSRGAVAGMVDRLEDRGFIRRIHGKSRSITIVEHAGISPELDARISAYCKNVGLARHDFDKRAAERFMRCRI